MYFFDALSTALANAFAKKGATAHKYPEKPYDIDESQKKQEDNAENEEQEILKAKLYMMQMVQAGKNWGK